MKKPSAARGHMTPEEIATHLDHAKIDHLQKILKKEKLLSPETKKNVNLALAEIYERVDPKKAAGIYKTLGGADIYSDHFGGRYGLKVLSNLGLSEEAVTILEAQQRWDAAATLCSKIAGDASERLRSASPAQKEDLQKLAWRSYRRASGLYEKVDQIEQAAYSLRSALVLAPPSGVDPQERRADAGHLGELFEKVAAHEERHASHNGSAEDKNISQLAQQRAVDRLKDAREHYEMAGDSAAVARVDRRITSAARSPFFQRAIYHKPYLNAIAILSLCGGVLFLSPTITGNAIINQATSSASASWMGGVLVLAGIIGVIGYMKFRRH